MRRPSGRPSVDMVKTAEHGPRDHSASGLQGRDTGTLEFEAAVRTIAVVIVGKFGEHGLQVAVIYHDEVVKTDPKVPAPGSRPETAKPDPQDSILSPEPRMRVGAQRDLKLMAEDQVRARDPGANERRRRGYGERAEVVRASVESHNRRS